MIQFDPSRFFQNSGAWCNGSTAVFGTVDLGSNPGAPAYHRMGN